MPADVFGSTSRNSSNTLDTSLFVQKPYFRIYYIQSKIEKDIELKNQYKIKNSPSPVNSTKAA